MARRKLTPLQRDEVVSRIAALDRRGWSEKDIGVEVGLSQGMVHNYKKKIRAQYAKETLEDRAALVGEKVQQLRELRKELWTAWDASKKPGYKRTLETIQLQDGSMREKLIKVRETRLPGAEYARLILETLREECELRGLYEYGDKLQLPATAFPWEMLYGRSPLAVSSTVEGPTAALLPDEKVDPVEHTILQLELQVEETPAATTPTPPSPGLNGNGKHH